MTKQLEYGFKLGREADGTEYIGIFPPPPPELHNQINGLPVLELHTAIIAIPKTFFEVSFPAQHGIGAYEVTAMVAKILRNNGAEIVVDTRIANMGYGVNVLAVHAYDEWVGKAHLNTATESSPPVEAWMLEQEL